MSNPVLTDYTCASSPAEGGGYRVSARVEGRLVAGWVNVYAPTLTPNLVANLLTEAARG